MDNKEKMTHKYDSDIVDILYKILNGGTFHAETINESILVKLMELRGTPITLNNTLYNRNVEKDWENYTSDRKRETLPPL